VQVTFDSSEPLEQVLAVLTAMYNTPLTASAGEQEQPPTASPSHAQPARRTRKPAAAAAQPATAARSWRTGRAAPTRVDVAAARAWARDHGITVNPRGQLAATVLAAYQTANP